MGDLIEEVVGPYRLGLSGRIAIDVHVAERLPPVQVDRTLLARAITNVIENALHAMPGTGDLASRRQPPAGRQPPANGRRHVRRRATRDDHDRDRRHRGGMDPEALARIFEPYFSTKATGTGLGLTIAKRNVELNGGSIAVHSEKGVGTTVTITLPLEPGRLPRTNTSLFRRETLVRREMHAYAERPFVGRLDSTPGRRIGRYRRTHRTGQSTHCLADAVGRPGSAGNLAEPQFGGSHVSAARESR